MGTRRTGIYEEEGQLFRPLTPPGNGAGILGDIHRASNQICGIYIYIQLYSSCLLLFTDSFLVHSFIRSFIHSFIDLFMFVYSWRMYLPIDLSVHLSQRHHIFVEFGIPRTASECTGSAV